MAKANPKSSGLRVVPLGGLGEIGMNCLALETDDEMIVIDCGVLFTDLEHFGIEFMIPNFSYLLERKEKLKAFVVTHAHEDHIGAIPFALKSGLVAPIYASPFSSLMVRERLKDYNLDETTELKVFKPGSSFTVGSFKVTTASVNHSIVESSALIIDTPFGKVVHTGDFRIDPSPYYGTELDPAPFQKAGESGVLLLLSDSTNVERPEDGLSECTLMGEFEQVFGAAKGLTVVSMFASNVGRMGQIFELAKKLKKRVAVTGRSMEQNLRLAEEAGYLKDVGKLLVDLEHIEEVRRQDLILMSTGSQGEFRSALARIAKGEHRQIQLQKGDLVVMSSRFIPGNERSISRVINNLFRQGATVLYDAIHHVHVSGHASRPELKRMLNWVKPKFFVPIHGEYRHLVQHAEVAVECGVKPERSLVAGNGSVIEVTRDSIQIVDQLEDLSILVDGPIRHQISKDVLKDRRKLAETGVVSVLIARQKGTWKLLSRPRISAIGLMPEARQDKMLEEAQKIIARAMREDQKAVESGDGHHDLAERVRVELRRFFGQATGKKPVVVPTIVDL